MPTAQVRVLQALTTGDPGGTELMVFRLLRQLDRARVMSDVTFLDGFGPMTRRFQEIGVPVHDLSGKGGHLGAVPRLLQLLRARRYHIMHVYGFRMSLLGRLVAHTIRRRPIIIHGIRGLHVTEGEEIDTLKTKVALGIERIGSRLIDAYIANSHGAVNFLTSRGLPQRKFFVIPNGIDVSDWNRQRERPLQKVPEIICAANFRPIKHHCDLVEALAILRINGMRLRCSFLGDGPTRQDVESLARARGLNEFIEFLGKREPEEVEDLLGASDIFVLPSLWEGLPRSVMEAMGAGLPVVGTDVNGINELVINGETGFLVPPKDPAALADGIEKLVRDPDLRRRMGEAGRLRITREFSLENMVRSYEHVYKELVQRKLETVPSDQL